MHVACSRCNTPYRVPPEKLAEGTLKVRCTRCGHVFGVRRKRQTAAELSEHAPELPLDFSAPTPPTPSSAAPSPPDLSAFPDWDDDATADTAFWEEGGALPELDEIIPPQFQSGAKPEAALAPEAAADPFADDALDDFPEPPLSEEELSPEPEPDFLAFDDEGEEPSEEPFPEPFDEAEPEPAPAEGPRIAATEEEEDQLPPPPAPESPSWGGRVATLMVLLTLLVAGGVFATRPEALTGLASDDAAGARLAAPVEGAYVERSGRRPLFVLTGRAALPSGVDADAVRLCVTLYGAGQAELGVVEHRLGAPVDAASLTSLTDDALRARLSQPNGGGGDLPFLAVIADPPSGIRSHVSRLVSADE